MAKTNRFPKSTTGVMTFPKYLVILGMLLAGWSMAGAAGSGAPDSAPAPSSTSEDSLTGTHATTHHRKHHGSQGDESTAKKKPGSASDGSSAAKTSSAGTGETSSAKNGGKKKSAASPDQASGKKSSSTEKAGEDSAQKSGETKKEPAAASENGSGNKKSEETSSHSHSRRHHHTDSTETVGSESVALKKKTEQADTAKPSAKTGSEPASASPTGKKPEATTVSATVKKEGAENLSSHETATEPAVASGKTPGGETGKTRTASEKGKEAAATAAHTESHSAKSPVVSTHHRHHREEPPPIVVTPSAVPLPEQVSPGEPSPTVLGGTTVPAGVAPTVETGLPVARPGAGTTASLPIDMGHRATGAPESKFHFTDYPPPLSHRSTRTYPWKSNIITTVFWIGEGGSSVSSTTNIQSAWDMNWVHHNGGTDNPDEMSRMSGYSSQTHASTLNPFYIALPFNDLAYPEEAQRWLPPGWYHSQHHGEKPVSACQGRWVEIKTGSGRVCYAQWEDVGPLVSDHPQYVFGPERPETLTRAGLDVSPAVAKYLGFESTALTSWRFVDDDDVQPGMWLRYDEQAILFQALKEQMHPSRTPRIQDLDEPVPDGSGTDSTEKRSGAARG
jgi:hypothetical protein